MLIRTNQLSALFCSVSLFLFGATGLTAQTAYVANVGPNTVAVVNNNAVTATINVPSGPEGIAVSPNGSAVYVTSGFTNSVSVISAATNTVTASIDVGATSTEVAVNPNGSQVYVISQSANRVAAISTASNTLAATIPVGLHPNSVTFSPDGTRAYVSNTLSGSISVINTSINQVINTFSTGSGPMGLVVTPDGGHIYVSNQYANTVTEHDIAGNVVNIISGFVFPMAMAITPNGARLYVTNGMASSVSVIDTGSNRILTGIGVGNLPVSVAISSDGNTAYVTNEYGWSLSVISTASNAVVSSVYPVGVSPVSVATQPAAPTSVAPFTAPCSFTVNAGNMSFGSGGGSSSISVSASSSSCSWTATGPNWVSLSGGSGTGNGSVNVSVGGNGTAQTLRGTITVAGQNLSVNESALAFAGVRVNCGGQAMTDASGNAWQADSGHNYSVTMSSIANASTPALYQKAAYATGSGLSYQLSAPNGSFTVKLHFAETYLTSAGARMMNVVINGTTVLAGLDILQQVGPNTAYDVTFPVSVTNGQVSVQVVPTLGSATLSGIEVY